MGIVVKRRCRGSHRALALFCALLFILLTQSTALSQGASSHKHRQHHGASHPRSSRTGRDTGSEITDDLDHLDNKHKPEFPDCDTYRPKIAEGKPRDTFVHTVRAVDKDPPSSGGTIRYSLITSERNDFFKIDNKTGEIRTKKSFDRDEPEREKVKYITVRASDNGSPQFYSVCAFSVTITDENDNSPLFDKYSYNQSIPQDMEPGRVVMQVSATDIDDGENGRVSYSLKAHPSSVEDVGYFAIDSQSGEIKLEKRVPEEKKNFFLVVEAADHGSPRKSSTYNISISTVDAYKKAPEFEPHEKLITISEDDNTNTPLLAFAASSHTDDGLVFFDLVNGQTQSTNKDGTFSLESNETNNKAYLIRDNPLDFEEVSQYTLTIRVKNKYDLYNQTSVTIQVKDVNDRKPTFTDVGSGTVLENEEPGTIVMRVRAIDEDGTSPNNEVRYKLQEADTENFSIGEKSGVIKTKKRFDREEKDVYSVTVYAIDGPPDQPGYKRNQKSTTVKIEIGDKNDNPPVFTKDVYKAEISEDVNGNQKVIDITAHDKDTGSRIKYSIIEGNIGDVFQIESHSENGVIKTKKPLDYETTKNYKLKIKASDSIHNATAIVDIKVDNVNDNPPKVYVESKNVPVKEAYIPQGCIFKLRAEDPDGLTENITFQIQEKTDHFAIDNKGCVRVTKELDYDVKTGGQTQMQVIVLASDGKLTETKILEVNLTDANDNAPKLKSKEPVVWYENRKKGKITELEAIDYDTEANGPPFKFRLDAHSPEIWDSFEIQGNELLAKKDNFDREEKKFYDIPIRITDNGGLADVSMLRVIIGDENDNLMEYGESSILVYKYKQKNRIQIGRVYVKDPDDWDHTDKVFRLTTRTNKFELARYGFINMQPSTEAGNYSLMFSVSDTKHSQTVEALVNVTVKVITDEAIDNSGSIRFSGITREEFITPNEQGLTKKDILQKTIAGIFKVPEDNVDVFTVNDPSRSEDKNKVDVRYAVHNSPYYKAERLDGKIGEHKQLLEDVLGLEILMVRINECLIETPSNGTGCTNRLFKNDASVKIFTNTSSFVGVNSSAYPEYRCFTELLKNSCQPTNPCLNNGICHSEGKEFRCECEPGFDGPLCEITSISVTKAGYAWYPPLETCKDAEFQVRFTTADRNGLIFYDGPASMPSSSLLVSDFISLELRKGKPLLLINFGDNVITLYLSDSPNLADAEPHLIRLTWSPERVTMTVDQCTGETQCTARINVEGKRELNLNGPLQVGGISFNPSMLQNILSWSQIPTHHGLSGCIMNMTYKNQHINLGQPSYANFNATSCDSPYAGVQKASLGVTWNFIIILLVCILLLLLLAVGVVLYKRKKTYKEVKGDFADDVRENIINYSDEGGGEGDQTGYDLSVLMKPTTDLYHNSNNKMHLDSMRPVVIENGEIPNIRNFLQGNKDKVDKDQTALPYDDVRNYAYEGDGNSIASLSSLASGTDDEDLQFDELPTYGPRFKKLADMYGNQSSDDDESYGHSGSWR